MIDNKKGQKRSRELKAQTYVECTSKDPLSVNNVFVEAIRVVLDREKKMKVKDKKNLRREQEMEMKMKARMDRENQKSKVK